MMNIAAAARHVLDLFRQVSRQNHLPWMENRGSHSRSDKRAAGGRNDAAPLEAEQRQAEG